MNRLRMIKVPNYEKIYDFVFTNLRLNYSIELDVDLKNYYLRVEDYEEQFYHFKEPIWLVWKDYTFPIFIYNEKIEGEFYLNKKITFDPVLNSFLFLSGWQEWISNDEDHFHRFKFENSLQSKNHFENIPIVNIYFEIIMDCLLDHSIILSKKYLFESNIILSHDIDRLYSGWFEESGFLLKKFNFKKFLNFIPKSFKRVKKINDDYFQSMFKILKIENQYCAQSIFFFLTSKTKKDADYNINDIRVLKLIKTILSQGHKIGLHPGLETYNNENKLQSQKNKLENILQSKISHIRQHYLQYNSKITPGIHKKCGFTKDYTLGFAEHYGFRNAICTPFFTYNFEKNKINEILEIPLFFMDGTLTHYMKGDKNKNFQEMMSILEKVNNHFNFNVSILFHNSVFTDSKYQGFTEMYQNLLKWIHENNILTKV